jgi:hypothetical protein
MSAELQIQSVTLAALAFRALKQGLRMACMPALPGYSIDHIEAVTGSATVLAAPSAVDVRIMADVFVVSDGALFAAPNATPIGATSPAGQIAITLRLEMAANKDGLPTLLQFTPQPPDLGALGAALGAAAGQAVTALQAILPTASIDLAPQLVPLGITKPATSDIVLTGSVVAIRFDVPQAPQSHLFPSQEWGFFVDGPGVAQLVRSRVEPKIHQSNPDANVSAAYAPNGQIPHVDLTVHDTKDILGYDDPFTITFPCDFSIANGETALLRVSVAWSVDVDGLDPFKLVQHGVQDKVNDAIAGFGGVKTGDQSFVLDTPLPALGFLGSVFRFDDALASQDGMTLGGGVVIFGVFDPPFTFSITPLGKPTRIQLCSRNARSGSGAPSTDPPSVFNTTSFGHVDVGGYGAICAVEVQAPNAALQIYVSSPPPGPESASVTIEVAIPYLLTTAMTAPLTLVLRTPRGVRLLDLGMAPKPQVDANGRILDVNAIYIPDCLYLETEGVGAVYLGWGLNTGDIKPHPVDGPDWGTYLQASGGLIVQLVTLTGLAAGELLQFRSATHAIDVTADAQGRARVPVLLPLSANLGHARLSRANGRGFDGRPTVQTAVFERHATLRGALRGGLEATPSGGVVVTTRRGYRDATHIVRSYGVTEQATAATETTELNPQPLPPVEDLDWATRLARAGIRGIVEITALPGFSSSGLAVAQTAIGLKLLLDLHHVDGVRIAGTFDGPMGTVHVAGDWAAGAAAHETAVFRHSPPPDVKGFAS